MLKDAEMYTFLESGVRGELSVISKKFAEANYLRVKEYNSGLPQNFLIYLDANGLYSWVMTQPLPVVISSDSLVL